MRLIRAVRKVSKIIAPYKRPELKSISKHTSSSSQPQEQKTASGSIQETRGIFHELVLTVAQTSGLWNILEESKTHRTVDPNFFFFSPQCLILVSNSSK